MTKPFKERLFERVYHSRFFPHIFFSRNPFKIFEYKTMVRGVAFDKQNDVILDLGCGWGLQTHLLGQRARRIVGIDVSQGAVGRAQSEKYAVEGLIPIEFICSSIEDAKFDNETFDKIFSFCVLEHIPDHMRVLQECHRVLKRGGQLILSVDSLATIDDPGVKRDHAANEKVLRYYSTETLQADLLAAGFGEIQIRPIFRGEFAKRLFTKGVPNRFVFRYAESILLYWILRITEYFSREKSEGIFLVGKCRK
jgi:ubiquinone/menaquinone biosynthesis C-methylase UbiE